MGKPLQTLHKSLLNNNYDVPEDYESFEQTLTAKGKEGFQNRYTLWKSLSDNGYDVPDNYNDFSHTLFQPAQSAAKPQQVPAPAQPKPKPKPTQAPVVSSASAPEDDGADDPVLGTPWGTEGSATGKSKAYKPFAPGQVRSNEKTDATALGVPYRPDHQMTAAARDEAYRQNDFAVKQVQKIRRENARRNQPVVDTGNPDINNSVIKTQGQWEDELQQGASRISSSVVVPAVDKAIADFDKKAHEVFEGTQKKGNAFGGLPTGTASGATIFGSIKESNKANDPDKVLEYLKGQFEDLYKDKSFVEEVGKEADKMGMDRTDYLEKVIKPQIESDLQTKFDSAMIDKYLPKSGKEYVVNGLSNSIIGMLADAFLETKGQRNYKNQAAAMTEEGDNPYYTPGTGAKLAQMGVSFAADAPFFGVYGKVSGQVAKTIAEREIQKLIGKGLSEGAARSIVGSALENSVGARMKNYIMQHVVGGALTMGGYNATSETARQIRDKEGIDLGQIAGSTAEGLAVGSAFGLTGGVSQALSQPLTGISKIGAKVAGFGAEAETMYATEELSKLVHGEDAFTNPFEGSVEALEKLGVMKLSGGHLFESGAKKLMRAKEVGAKQAIGESLAELLGSAKTGVKFTEDEQSYIRNSQEGKDLVESLANMHPDRAIEEVNGKKKFTKEGEQQRQQLAENYDRFMNNPDIPAGVKEKIAKMFGGIYRTGLETGVTINQNEDGSVILKTRDQDGNCVRDLKFDNLNDAEQWRDQFKSQMSRNDAVNMFNNAPKEVQQNIVNIVRDEVSGKTAIDELKSQAGSMKQKRLKRQLEKISQTAEQYEGREMTDEEARNYIQMVIKDGDDAVFNEMYDLIRENAHPADELNTKRNYWEGQQLSTMERHYAQVEAQLAEERLRLQGDAFAEEIIGAADYPDEKMAELATRSDVTKEQLEAALNYYNKSAKVNGMMDEALKSVDNQVEAANAYVRKNTHTDSGSLIEGNYQGRNYYVTAGHFQISPEGRLVPTDNSGLVILRDKETGDIVTASPNDIQVTGIQDPNRIIEYNESMEGLRGQLIKQADESIELNPETPTEAANGDIYVGADGNMYIAIQIQDETGNPVWAKIAIDETGNPVGNPMPFDNDEYRKAKSNDLDAAEMPQEEILSPESVQIEQNQPENAQTGENYAQNQPENIQSSDLDNAGAEASAANGTGAYDAPAPALSRIPVDEKGRKIYEQAKPEDTLAELTEKYGEEKAQQMISKIAESTAKELEKLQQTDTSAITDMADLEVHEDKVTAAQAKADYWNAISENIKNENAKKVWENLVNPKEIRNFATDPESQAKWVDEHFDEIVDSYIRTHGNNLDPDKIRDALTPIGYNGKNVPDFKNQGKRLTRAIYDKMLQDAVASGKTSITLLTGAGGAGKSKATEEMDFSDRGIVYDSAFNNINSLDKAIDEAKKAGMKDIQVVAVYNDAVQSFENTVKRGLKNGRFLSLEYFVNEAFTENQGKIAELRKRHPDVDIVCIDNSGNRSAERPDRGRVSVEQAENWDYTVNDAKLNELLDILDYGIDKGRFTEDQAASIGRGLRDVTRSVGDIRPETVERIGGIERRLRGQDGRDILPDLPRGTSGLGGHNVVSTPDGEVQGSSEERPSEGESRPSGQGTTAETRTDGEVRTGSGKPAGSDDDGPEPPAAGGSGLGQSQQHAPAAGGSGAPATRGSGNGPASAESELTPAQKKVYQKAVEANIGRTFTFSYGNGTSSVLKVQRIDHNGNTVIMRQDYDAQGHPVGNPVEERYDFKKVGKAIVENTWKKHLDTDEELRQKYNYHKRTSGDVPIIDVLTDDEKRQILDALRRGDTRTAGYLEGEFINQHHEDLILRGREIRNEKVEKAFARNGRGERLRGVRDQYKAFDEASTYLSDEAMQPQTIEEYVADALGDVPKMGKGFLAYTSYDQGGNEIVGLKDETGFGSRGFGGDTKGFNPWLAPKGKGISLKQFAEQLHESLPEGMKQQYSDQDLRNIIWNVLTSAEKPTDIANYILRNRVDQAEAAAKHSEDEAMDAPSYQKVVDDQSFASRLQRGKESVNTDPTEGQKEAGNYKKGHISFGGYDFTIENPEGSMRRGKDATGREWEQKMNNTYGYILGKFGKDGDHLDMFINDAADLDNWNGTVYVVDQVDPKTGKFDEHKVLYGFDSLAEAKKAYLSNYEEGWKGLGRITGVTKEGFDKWLDSSKRKMKEFADHSIAKEHMVESEHTGFDSSLKQLNTRGISINDPELMKEYGLKDIVLSKTGDHVTLNKIVVEKQGEGNGTRFMEDLARLADEKGWTLALTPSGGFGAKSIKRLKDFYKRFGFADNKGRNADFYTRESMIRRPKETIGANTPERQEQALRDAVVEYLRSKGIEVSTDWKLGQKILDDYNGGGKLSASKKRALDTVVPRDNSPFKATAVSSADGAKVLKDLETLAKKSENLSIRGKNSFIGDVADALGAQMKGSKSKYAKFETDDGTEVIIRLADHNATVSQFDYKGEDNGISIVISRKPNKGITNDGDARLVEVFYPDKALKKAEGNPYAEIVKSISNALHTGDYKDTTGLAEREEVNADEIKQHKTKFFKTGDGYAYGYTLGGKIYVDPRIATSETPIHEYGHLYCAMKRQTDPEGWNEWKQVMLNDELAKPIIDKVKRDYPELEGKEDDFAEEIITQFSGKRGSERLREIAEEVAKEKGGIFGKAEAVTAMQRLKSILNRFWEGVAKMMGWKYTNANQIADRIMADMLNGVDPTKKGQYAEVSNPSFQMVGKEGAANADWSEGTKTRLENNRIAEEMEKTGKDPKVIKFATGWERGADGQWRYEIPDADVDILSKYKAKVDEMKKKGVEKPQPIIKLGDLLGEDNELFKYYPELKKTDVLFSNMLPDGVAGKFDGANIELNAKETSRFDVDELNNENVYGTLLHEVQHAIQEIEGFAQGGSLQTSTTEAGINAIIAKKEAERDRIKTELDAINQVLSSSPEEKKEYAELAGRPVGEYMFYLENQAANLAQKYDNINSYIEKIRRDNAPSMTDAKDLYHRLAGEVEARNVTSRMKMTDTERMTHTAEETEDTPRNDQAIIMGDQKNEQKSSAEAPKFQKVEDDTHSDNFKNFFGDWEKDPENSSKIVDGRGEPMVVYHQTANDFTVFDPRHKGSGTNDYQLPFGIFMKPTARNIGLGGEKQMPLYANIRKPLRVENRQVLSALLKSKVEGYKEALAEYDRIDKEYAKKFDEAEKFDHERNVENWNKWKSGEMTEQEYQDAISDTAENVINQWEEAQNKPISEMKELIDSYFRNSEYDGIWIAKDEGSMGRSTETIIAFEPNQVKSATNNTGAYDPNNPDIRFQRVGNPEPEMTPEERQYWNKWDAAMKKWKERNAIPADQTAAPEKPRYQQGESALDYAQKLVQWNRMKSLWQTAPKLEDYRQVRDDKDIVEAARQNEQRYPDSPSAKMRRVASDMMRIRHAMSRQKAYDKATVKAVTDFAHEFMKLGFGDNLSRGEIERMLSSVKNATGAKDIKKNVDNIMNILIDNHLRNLDQRVQKLSSTKELSKTAQGVEKQGRLELKGQRMIQAFRDAREKRMTLEQINERMADVAEKMNRSDDEAPMWEQEYEGLAIARQYVENIEGSRQEWADLDTLYKDAVKDYKTSGRSYKAQQELLESIEQAMQENKIERIGMYGDVINRLEGNIAESMQGAKEFVEREKQQVKLIHTLAARDMDGKDADADHVQTWKSKLNNTAVPRLLLGPLGTFEQMMKMFGGKNANGEGWLYNHFMRNYIDSVNREQLGREKALGELDKKVSEVFGKKMRWSDLYSLERDTKKFPTAEVKWLTADGEEKSHTLSQGNMLSIYMWDKMADGRMKLRQAGITEDVVEQIKERLDPRFVELADWLQSEFLVNRRTEYNKVYERVFGAPMAAIENYFPLRILGDSITRNEDVTADPTKDNVLPSTITGSVIKRKRNSLPLDILNTDAFSLTIEHIDDMEKWAAFVEWYKDVNTLLSYNRFKNQVKNMNTIYGSGDKLWENFRKAAQLASGTYRPTRSEADKAITTIASGVTGAKIALRPFTALKQLTSSPAFIYDASAEEYAKCFLNPKNFWHDNIKWAMENLPVLRKRWQSRDIGDTRLMDTTGWGYWDTKVRGFMAQYGMAMNGAVDVATCAAGARAIYRTRLEKYKKQGFTEEQANKRALQDAAIGYNLTQQSSEGAFVSTVQKDRTLFANMWSVFRNSSMAYTRQSVDAVRNLNHLIKYKDDSIDFMKKQFEAEGLSSEDAQKAAKDEYKRAYWHNAVKLAVSAWVLPIFWDLSSKIPYLGLGDDEEEKKSMVNDVLRKELVSGPTEGLMFGQAVNGLWGAASSRDIYNTYKNEGFGKAAKEGLKQMANQETSPLPLFSDMGKLLMKFSKDEAAGLQDMVNLAVQMGTGLNPQTITDPIIAAIDASRGDLGLAKETELFLLRLLMVPEESAKNVYLDEIGMTADKAKKLSFNEAAERYAKYKTQKGAPFFSWMYNDDAEQKRRDSYVKKFTEDVQKRIDRLNDEELLNTVGKVRDAEEKALLVKLAKKRLNMSDSSDEEEIDKPKQNKDWYQKEYSRMLDGNDLREDELLSNKIKGLYDVYNKKHEEAAYKSAIDEQEFFKANKEWKKRLDDAKSEVKKRMDWIRDGKYDTESGRKSKRKDSENDPEPLYPGKKDLIVGDDEANEKIMKNIRKWRKEALEILMRAEAEQ